MSLDHDPPQIIRVPDDAIVLDETILVLWLTVIARAIRSLDGASPPRSVAQFCEALDRSLELELQLSRTDEVGAQHLTAIHGVLVQLLENMPPDEYLP